MTLPEPVRVILKSLAKRGVRIDACDGKLHVDGPKGALTEDDKKNLSVARIELLAFLQAAGEAREQALAVLDSPRARAACRGKQARVNVLQVYKEVVEAHHASKDPILFDDAVAVEKLLERWAEAVRYT